MKIKRIFYLLALITTMLLSPLAAHAISVNSPTLAVAPTCVTSMLPKCAAARVINGAPVLTKTRV